jgi:hypothetical protein
MSSDAFIEEMRKRDYNEPTAARGMVYEKKFVQLWVFLSACRRRTLVEIHFLR